MPHLGRLVSALLGFVDASSWVFELLDSLGFLVFHARGSSGQLRILCWWLWAVSQTKASAHSLQQLRSPLQAPGLRAVRCAILAVMQHTAAARALCLTLVARSPGLSAAVASTQVPAAMS